MTRVIPSARLLTVVHLRDPRVRAKASGTNGRAHTGQTLCGLPMLLEEAWIPWPHGDAPDCTKCIGAVAQVDSTTGVDDADEWYVPAVVAT